MKPPADIIAAAEAAEKKWGVPASISIAQWALESAWGKHMPPGSNNPFGIKARTAEPSVTVPTREVVNGKPIIVNAPFRKFASIAEAFDRHGELLATAPIYARARAYEKNPDKFAAALTGTYATDPKYADLLHAIMHGANLYQYDGAPA